MKTKSVDALNFTFSAVGFGCWAAGGGAIWNGTEDAASIQTIQRAVELGVNFFDVAPVYGFGHAETILGQALGRQRQDVIIATKCGLVWDDQGNITNDLKPATIEREIEDSLRRLNTDYVDIYQIHWPDPATPIQATMETLNKLKTAGKIRHIGVSNFSTRLMDEARQYSKIVSHQGLYNLLERNPTQYHNIPLDYRTEQDVFPYCRQHGMAFFPYSPLFQGLLTDHFKPQNQFDTNDVRSANPKLNGKRFETYYQIRGELFAFAMEIGKPLSQVAINWLIHQDAITSVICGAQTIAHVEENVASASWDFTPDMLAEVERILRPYHDPVYTA
ncbi:MAG: aldo/keto reductase [Anaerolineaceae bacterium]|nr:aldo/keto reductase [Anaerolineaceae bacterium]